MTDNRMASVPRENLERFTILCGMTSMPQVVLVTTMWSMVGQEVADARLRELKDTFWKHMIKDGCRVEKFGDSQESALRIIGSNGAERVILIEKSIETHKKITDIGIAHNKQLTKLMKDMEAADRRLKELTGEYNSCQINLISRTDKVVVVMGPTKAGKSTVRIRPDLCFRRLISVVHQLRH